MTTRVTNTIHNRTNQDVTVRVKRINKKDGSSEINTYMVLASQARTTPAANPSDFTLENVPNCFLVWNESKGTAEIKNQILIRNNTNYRLKYLISDDINDVNDFRKINENVNSVVIPCGGAVSVDFIPNKFIGVAGPTALHYDGVAFTHKDIVC